MPRTGTQDAPKKQIDKFREAARELGTDERDDAFDEIVRKIAKNPPTNENDDDGRETKK